MLIRFRSLNLLLACSVFAFLGFAAGRLLAEEPGAAAATPDKPTAASTDNLPPPAKTPIAFEKHIQPLLRAKCFSCHAGEEEAGGLRLDAKQRAMDGGDNGPVIVAGNSATSRLVQLIAEVEAGERMPPEGEGTPLSAEEIGLVRAWIDQGANWPASADVAESQKSDHWSFQPIANVAPPAVKQTAWVRNPIDAFILAKLEAEGVAPSPEADRATLLRRLSLDLVGLPPTVEEVTAFIRDERPDAYEQQVERLLASPHYGERWARRWLDLARYADSDGYEKDLPRPFAWRWRDWVINALNADMPFDQFTREQIAGDLLPNATNEQRVATGFHRNTLINREGGIDKEEDRVKRTIDRTNTVGAVWLGLTVGCAQCHNHKYDPITQRDYFSFYAFFNSLDEPDIPAAFPQDIAAYAQAMEAFKAEHAPYLKAIEQYEAQQLSAAQQAWEATGPNDDRAWKTLLPQQVTSANGSTLTLLEEGIVTATGKNPDSDIYTFVAELKTSGVTAIRLEALPDKSLTNSGPGRSYRGNFVLSEFKLEVAPLSQPDEFQPVKIAKAQADFEQQDWPIRYAIDGQRKNGWAIAPQFGKPHVALFELAQDLGSEEGVLVRVTLDQFYESEAHNLGRFRLSTTKAPRPVKLVGMPAEMIALLQIPAGERNEAQLKKIAQYYRTIDAGLVKLQLAEQAHAKTAPVDPNTLVKAQVIEQMAEPRETKILVRGDFLQPGATVETRTPGVLPPLVARGERPDRLDLAEWLVSSENPLTARVTVNRIWARYFGRGIVESVDNFGTQGELPVHPELLDYLATQFRERGWSLKQLHRAIVTSNVYRQSSAARPELDERDPYNSWLARQNRLRVEAEVVRDLALSASGLLVPTIGGPSVHPPQPAGIAALGYAGSVKWKTSTGPDRFRRGLYTFFQRTVPYPMLTTFDAPDSNVACLRRERSNTPLQSLTLWNDPVFFECAQQLGRRIVAETTLTPARHDPAAVVEQRLGRAVQLCLSREPSQQETTILRDLYQKQFALCQADAGATAALIGSSPVPTGTTEPELAAWIIVGRTLMNLDEFVTKE
jgi:hypothetical protein